jgi:hypothetical protein
MKGQLPVEGRVSTTRLRDGVSVPSGYPDDVSANVLKFLLGDAFRNRRMPLLLWMGGSGQRRQLVDRQLPLIL